MKNSFGENSQNQDDPIGHPDDVAVAHAARNAPESDHNEQSHPDGYDDDHLPFCDGLAREILDLGGENLQIGFGDGD